MDNFVSGSSHDYEDPEEAAEIILHGKRNSGVTSGLTLADESLGGDSTLVSSTCLPSEESESVNGTLLAGPTEDGETVQGQGSLEGAKPPALLAAVLPNVCRTSPGNKNTDSGCYSGQGGNSDSDSGCENSSSVRDTLDPDAGYATLDSSFSITKQTAESAQNDTESVLTENNILSKSESPVSSSDAETTSALCDNSIGSSALGTFSADVSPDFHCSRDSPVKDLHSDPIATLDSHESASTSTPPRPGQPTRPSSLPSVTSSPGQPSVIPSAVPCVSSDDVQAVSVNSAGDLTPSECSPLPEFTSPLKLYDSSCTSEIPAMPSPGDDEYSFVVKRSDRLSLEVGQASPRSSTATLMSTSGSISHSHSCSSRLETESSERATEPPGLKCCGENVETSAREGEEEGEDNVFQSVMVVGLDKTNVKMFSGDGENAKLREEMELALSLSCNNNTESYYEPVGQGVCRKYQVLDDQDKGLCTSGHFAAGHNAPDNGVTSQGSSISTEKAEDHLDLERAEASQSGKSEEQNSESAPELFTSSQPSPPAAELDLSLLNESEQVHTEKAELRLFIPTASPSDELKPDSKKFGFNKMYLYMVFFYHSVYLYMVFFYHSVKILYNYMKQ